MPAGPRGAATAYRGEEIEAVIKHLPRFLTSREGRSFEETDGADDNHIYRDELDETDLIVRQRIEQRHADHDEEVGQVADLDAFGAVAQYAKDREIDETPIPDRSAICSEGTPGRR